jgi:type IV pilus assembly protein PilE
MKKQKGFTLTELLITMVIVAILAAVAVPAYRESIRKSKRRAAQSSMMDYANREQQYFVANRVYGDESDLGCDTSLPTEVSDNYTCTIAVVAGTPPTFTITFTAIGGQAADGNLTLDSTGLKGPAAKW